MSTGKSYVSTNGYVMIHVGKGRSKSGYIAEHVLKAERALGRQFDSQKHPVHHFDEDGQEQWIRDEQERMIRR